MTNLMASRLRTWPRPGVTAATWTAGGGADRLGTELAAHPGDIPAALTAGEAAIRPEAERKRSSADA
ncbi:hypothetical protein [Rhizohabitans arisaemae]|uniref:hypothetical protein n=1 Tax=Rhizohabitans arisaemae TaxID=2720610 RepID=UPI0024B0715B|nr:hypothetical protein [Rhizohabitans arisaemae]